MEKEMLKLKNIKPNKIDDAIFSFELILSEKRYTGINITVGIPQYTLGKTSSPLLLIVGSRLAR